MATSGTVKSWKGPFGFAETDDGQLVYIHTSEIGGGKLRMGLRVNFDIEKVEGHENRVKGVNVSGGAVLGKGEKLEDGNAEKARIKGLKDAQKHANMKEYEPVKQLVDGLSHPVKIFIARELIKELGISDKIAMKDKKAPVAAGKRRPDRGGSRDVPVRVSE